MSDESFSQHHGRSPSRDLIWEGPATGSECAVCGAVTKHGEIEVEIRYGLEEGSAPKTYHLHLTCLERERNLG